MNSRANSRFWKAFRELPTDSLFSSSPSAGDTARSGLWGPLAVWRLRKPSRVDLIHRTARGEMVRAKSEVIIAKALAAKGVDYAYERPLTLEGPHGSGNSQKRSGGSAVKA